MSSVRELSRIVTRATTRDREQTAQDLADDFGRKVRNQIADESFRDIFPGVSLKDDSAAVRRFHLVSDNLTTTQGGAYFAVGVGGPLTGRGAHLLLIDDPVKNREEADSEVIRRRTQGWYTSTAYTRLMPGGRVVVIQTRWHEDDLAGWLQASHGHEGWEVLDLPAIDDTGNALWPDQYDVTALNRIRAAIGPRDWSALYQQRPAPEDGDLPAPAPRRRDHPGHPGRRRAGTGNSLMPDWVKPLRGKRACGRVPTGGACAHGCSWA